ncbi:helix-turn-helix domain-containing protein [Peribacillus loiseleuriae]|uniref:helix-turn-helix domain-containing protein n=1 Tax=Peribacillus loiseleuriae TaxID=1679170 RepID=UPI0037F5076D
MQQIYSYFYQSTISIQRLREISGISSASVATLGKGENITTEVLLRICTALKCDIMEVVEDNPTEEGIVN